MVADAPVRPAAESPGAPDAPAPPAPPAPPPPAALGPAPEAKRFWHLWRRRIRFTATYVPPHGAPVTGSELTASPNALTRLRSAELNLVASNAYAGQVKAAAGDSADLRSAWLVVHQQSANASLFDHVLRQDSSDGPCTWQFQLEYQQGTNLGRLSSATLTARRHAGGTGRRDWGNRHPGHRRCGGRGCSRRAGSRRERHGVRPGVVRSGR